MKQLSGEEYLNLVDRYYSVLVFFARKWTSEKAEDVVQDAFLKLIRHSDLFGPPDDAPAWLFKVVRTTSIDSRRKTANREKYEENFSRRRVGWFEERPENRLDAEQAAAELAELPDELREIVEMRVWGSLSFEEIAELTQTSKTTVFRRYSEALEILRRKLS